MAKAEEIDVDGVAVRLTSPDKVYFPQLGSKGTKGNLVEYYQTVATGGQLLAALRDRPTHLQRFPDGIEEEEIYQKRVPEKRPEYLQTCRVTFPSGRTADALNVTHPSAIVWAAQMGTITLHPWQVRCPDTEHPDELRVDLDPQPGTGFAEARTIAIDILKPVLDALGLIGYPKTSGGRGLHVFVRIRPDWDFVAVRRAGIALARELERRAPDLVTTSWWKEERGQRVFIDYNQNARDRTFASAYSVRATPIATVSTPLTWQELADAEPDDFTIATVPALIAKRGDPMADLDSVAYSIDPLLAMAAADEERGLGDLPYPENRAIPRCLASRRACSRARRSRRIGMKPVIRLSERARSIGALNGRAVRCLDRVEHHQCARTDEDVESVEARARLSRDARSARHVLDRRGASARPSDRRRRRPHLAIRPVPQSAVVDVEPLDQSVSDTEDIRGVDVVPRFAERAGRPDLQDLGVTVSEPSLDLGDRLAGENDGLIEVPQRVGSGEFACGV